MGKRQQAGDANSAIDRRVSPEEANPDGPNAATHGLDTLKPLAIDSGSSSKAPFTSDEMLQSVYDQLRQLAAAKLHHEQSNLTLQATALVHETYLRLSRGEPPARWDSQGHFFAAAAKAMRRILVDHARQKQQLKRGRGKVRQPLDEAEIANPEPREDLVALDIALEKLAVTDPLAAELTQLRYFTGMTLAQAAQTLNMSTRSADRLWAYARAWLHQELQEPNSIS